MRPPGTPPAAAAGMNDGEYRRFFEHEETFWWFTGMRRIFAALLGSLRLPADGRVRLLDVGCGTGGFVRGLGGGLPRAGGALVPFLVDAHPLAVRYCARRGLTRLCRASADSLPFADAAFDIVTCLDVLQAVPDDRRAMGEFFRVCRPGGYLLVSDAAYEFLRDENSEAAGVLRRYTRRRLAGRVRAGGFVVRRATYTNALLFPPIAAARCLAKAFAPHKGRGEARTGVRPYPRWLNALLHGVMALESRLVRRVDFPCGVSVTVLAQKPE